MLTGTGAGGAREPRCSVTRRYEGRSSATDGGGDRRTPRPKPESLAPAVTRAARILDVLAESGGEPVGPSELARRLGLPKSSIANICGALADAGLVRRIGTGFALGRRLAELGGRVPRLRRPGPGVLRGVPDAAGRLRGDRPVRGPRRDRGDLPRPSRRPPAGPADVGDRPAPAGLLDRDRQGRAGLAPRRRARSPAGGPDDAAPGHAKSHGTGDASRRPRRGPAAGLRDRRRGDHGGRRVLRDHGPGRRPGEGPYAASITLLKVRATAERVPALIDDLRWLAAELSDPLRRK